MFPHPHFTYCISQTELFPAIYQVLVSIKTAHRTLKYDFFFPFCLPAETADWRFADQQPFGAIHYNKLTISPAVTFV